MGKPALLYTNYLPTATVTATDSYAGTDPVNVLGSTEDVFWRPANTTAAKTLTFDFDEVRNVNAVAFVGEELDGVTVTVEGSADGTFTDAVTLVNAEVLSSPVNVAWEPITQTIYRHVRCTFSTFGNRMRISHIIFAFYSPAPYFEDDWDPQNITDTGEVQMSAGGLYLGAFQLRTMRSLTMRWGQVWSVEYAVLNDWVNNCIRRFAPFVLVPDTDEDEAYFGWVDNPRFSSPYNPNGGYREVDRLTMMTRAQ